MTTNTKTRKEKKAKETGADPRPLDEAEVRRSAAEEEKDALETLEFLQAVDEFKRRTNKAFPAWSEILEILKSLGYRKIDD